MTAYQTMTAAEMVEFRARHKLRQEDLAVLIGRHRAVFRRWERTDDDADPIPKVVAELLRAWDLHGIPERLLADLDD